MSTISFPVVAARLTTDRLGSYLASANGDLEGALALYDWNSAIGGAIHEDLGRFEVVLRNALDWALVAHGDAQGWPTIWYSRTSLFAGRHGRRALDDIRVARLRIARRNAAGPMAG